MQEALPNKGNEQMNCGQVFSEANHIRNVALVAKSGKISRKSKINYKNLTERESNIGASKENPSGKEKRKQQPRNVITVGDVMVKCFNR